MKVPFYSINDYSKLIKQDYNIQTCESWLDFYDVLKLMDDDFINKYKDLDSRDIGNIDYVKACSYDVDLDAKVNICEGKTIKYGDFINYLKLFIPTLWKCEYFNWHVGKGTHHGVDFMMPKGTPLISFIDGQVIRVKNWDGKRKDEGNCVVIRGILDGEYVFVCYEHMERIDVRVGDELKFGDIIGTVGTTGNSTQYHLHLQIDKNDAPFHPFWSRSQSIQEINNYTIDPIVFLRKMFKIDDSKVCYFDMPTDKKYADAIEDLSAMGVIKGFNGYIYPNNNISRYEFALMMYRVISKFDLESYLNIKGEPKEFSDIDFDDPEFKSALEFMGKYGVLKGVKNKFYPHNNLTGCELIAVLGRIFFGLEDSTGAKWYLPYLDMFATQELIPFDWKYLKSPVPRKEIFRILSKLVSE